MTKSPSTPFPGTSARMRFPFCSRFSAAPTLSSGLPRPSRSLARVADSGKNVALAALRAARDAEQFEEARLKMLAALARLDDPDALSRLRELAVSSDPDRRLTAVRALRFSPTRGSAALLAPLTDDEDAVVRVEALSALSSMTKRDNQTDDPPFGSATKWLEWLRANPDARLYDPPTLQRDIDEFYDW